MVIKWIKWKIYIRSKRKWNKLFAYSSDFNVSFWLLNILFNLVKFFVLFFSSTLLSEHLLTINIHSIELETDIQHLIWSLFFFILFSSAILNGFDSLKWSMNTNDIDWLLSNTNINKKKLLLMNFLEINVWNTSQVLLNHIPIALGISIAFDKSNLFIIVILIAVFTSFLLTSLFISMLFTNIKIIQLRTQTLITRFIPALTLRILIVYLTYSIGEKTVVFFKDFTLNNLKQNPDVLLKIINSTQEILLVQFQFIVNDVFLWRYWIFNAISNLISLNNLTVSILTLILTIVVCLIIIILSEVLKSLYREETPTIKISLLERIFVKVLTLLSLKGYIYKAKVFLRSQYFFNRITNLLGSLAFWAFIGVSSSFIKEIDPSNNLYYLILSFFMFFPIFFFVNTFFVHFSGIFSLESEQNVTTLHFMAKKTLWNIFKRNFILNLLLMIPILVTGDILFYFMSDVSIFIFLLLLFIHITSFIFFATLNYIPSVTVPHFNFERLEEIDQFSDKEWVSNIINVVLNGLIIPLFLLPTALLISGTLNTKTYLVYQFVLVTLLIILLNFIVIYFIKRRLLKIKSIEKYS